MTRSDSRPFAWGVAFALWAAMHCCGRPVEAQADDALVLARVVLHESGFSVADVPGIYAALRRGADRRGISFAGMARAYSPRAHAGMTSRPWATELDASCDRPGGYPLPWTQVRRGQCEAFIAAAREAVSAAPTCAVDDWGDARESERVSLGVGS